MRKSILILLLTVASFQLAIGQKNTTSKAPVDSSKVPVVSRADIESYISQAIGYYDQNTGQYHKGYLLREFSGNKAFSTDDFEIIVGAINKWVIDGLGVMYQQCLDKLNREKINAPPKTK